MTTFAFDGRILAIDSQVTCGSAVVSTAKTKLFQLHDGKYMAAAGDQSQIHLLYSWLMNGADPDKAPSWPEPTVDAVIVAPGGSAEEYCNGVFIPVEGCCVGGSGYHFALAALHLGCNAVEAVECARSLDCYTGGAILFFDSAATGNQPVLGRQP